MTINRVHYFCEEIGSEYEGNGDVERYPVENASQANLVSSQTWAECGDDEMDVNLSGVHLDLHAPVIDIDLPIRAVPSTTEGHFHLYIEKKVPWEKYVQLLVAFAEAGLVEPGYVRASIRRGASFVRKEGVRKEDMPLEAPKGEYKKVDVEAIVEALGEGESI